MVSFNKSLGLLVGEATTEPTAVLAEASVPTALLSAKGVATPGSG